MYLLPDNRQWDSDYFHTLISDKHIISSSEAKAIREKLTHAGALPYLDNNYDWATLCIGYCFAKGWAQQPEKLTAAPDTKGIDIPRPLQKSPSPNSRNLNTGFRLFLFQISTDSTQIPP